MRSEVEHHLFVASAENPGVGEGRHTRDNLDGTATGVIENTIVEGPSVDVPNPAGNRTVDKGCPEESENHGRQNSATFSCGTNDESSSDSTELHL